MFHEIFSEIPSVAWNTVIGGVIGTVLILVGREVSKNISSNSDHKTIPHRTRRGRTVRFDTTHKPTTITRHRP